MTSTDRFIVTHAATGLGELFALKAVSFSIAGRPLLAPLDLSLPAGRVIGLIGHNGSGRSTLVKLLTRQRPVSSGAIDYEGMPLRDRSDRAFARKVAYLPQQTPAAGMHDVNMAARFCDEIIALHGGRLIARGSPREIMEAGMLQAIYGIPMKVIWDPDQGRQICFPQ